MHLDKKNHIVTEDNKNLRENKQIVKKRQTIVFFYSSQFDKVDQKTHNSVLMRAAEPRVVEDSGWLCSQGTQFYICTYKFVQNNSMSMAHIK